MNDPYNELGLTPVINACGTVTMYGGSLMADEVMDAMRAASRKFVPLDEVHARIGERIAHLLQTEAAYVTSGAACGLLLTSAACMAGRDPDKIVRLPNAAGMKSEIVLQAAHRIPYDQALRVAGARLVEIAAAVEDQVGAVAAAVTNETAAIFYCAHAMGEAGIAIMAFDR